MTKTKTRQDKDKTKTFKDNERKGKERHRCSDFKNTGRGRRISGELSKTPARGGELELHKKRN